MRITVRYYGYLQVMTGATEDVIGGPGDGSGEGPLNTLADVLDAAARRRPRLREVGVIGPELDRNLFVLRNHERVPGRSLDQTTVADGDIIDLVPPLGGGGAL